MYEQLLSEGVLLSLESEFLFELFLFRLVSLASSRSKFATMQSIINMLNPEFRSNNYSKNKKSTVASLPIRPNPTPTLPSRGMRLNLPAMPSTFKINFIPNAL